MRSVIKMSALGNKEIMARNIKRYMQKMGISRKDFCERLGFAYSTVTDWLNAEKYPRIDKIEMMANFFGISKADLVEPPASSAPPAPQKSDGLPERDRTANGGPAHASAREMHQLEKILAEPNLTYNGVALGAEDIEKINRALELAFWDAKEKNKRKK